MKAAQRAARTPLAAFSLALMLFDFMFMGFISLFVGKQIQIVRDLGLPLTASLRTVVATPIIFGVLAAGLLLHPHQFRFRRVLEHLRDVVVVQPRIV